MNSKETKISEFEIITFFSCLNDNFELEQQEISTYSVLSDTGLVIAVDVEVFLFH